MSRLGSAVPLVARRRELDALRVALSRARHADPGVVLLGGEAGVGKSRLLRELSAEATAAGDLVLTGRCVDIGEAGLPYLAFAEAFGELRGDDLDAARRRPALGRMLPSLGTPEGVEPDVASSRRERGPTPEQDIGRLQLFEAVLALLAELSARRTVLLAVEDLHWADSATRDLFALLATRLRGRRILLLGTYRSDELHRGHPLRAPLAEWSRLPVLERIELAPLAADDALALIEALADVPTELARRLAERCEGNPFFAEELAAAAGENHELPAALADVLLARIDRLSQDTQRLLRLISVARRRVSHDRLRAVLCKETDGPVALEEPLREALAHHVLLVHEDGRYQFRHALLREAVYADLLPGERVRLHARYAELIAADPPGRGRVAALAYHSLASNDLVTALSAAVTAAEEAARVGAPSAALAQNEQALKLWDAVPVDRRPEGVRLADLTQVASYRAATSGEVERAIDYARLAVTEADALGETDTAVHARHRLMQALSGVDGHDEEIHKITEQAWQLVEDAPPSVLRCWTLARRAANLRLREDPQARAVAELAIAESAGRSRGAAADALTTVGLLDDAAGDAVSAHAHLSEAVAAAPLERAGDALRAKYFLALHHHNHGELRAGLAVCTEALDGADELGLSWSLFAVELRALLIVLATAAGEWALAQRHAALDGGPESNLVLARIAATGTMVTLARGDFDTAAAGVARLREHWHRDFQVPLYAGTTAIELALWRARPLEAVAHAGDLLDWFAGTDECQAASGIRIATLAAAANLAAARATGEQVYAEAAERAHARAEHVAAHASPGTGTLGPEALAWLAQARAQRAGDAESWAAVVRAFGYGDPYREGLARLRHAEALLATGDRDGCAGELRSAQQAAEQLGAAPLADAARALATRAGVAGATAATGDPLTPREHAVLDLVATGRTNREVGAELFISEKTVSVHLSRAMGKLGVTRRAEAVAVAYDRGLLTRPDADGPRR